jgi:hypothetical protein
MRYATVLDWFLLIGSFSFGIVNGIIGPFVLVVNLKLVGSLLRAEAAYHNGGIDMDKFTNEMIVACAEYFAIGMAMFVAGFLAVNSFQRRLISNISVNSVKNLNYNSNLDSHDHTCKSSSNPHHPAKVSQSCSEPRNGMARSASNRRSNWESFGVSFFESAKNLMWAKEVTKVTFRYMDRIREGTGEKIIVLLQGVFNLIAGVFVGFGMK